MRALAIIVAFALAGCANLSAVKSTCIPLRAYTKDEQLALAAALEALPGSSPLVGAMEDFDAMRRADRACLGKHL